MSNTCENCVHNPICEWCEEHTKGFFRPKKSADLCYMFCNVDMFRNVEKRDEANVEACACEKECPAPVYCEAFDHTIALMRSPDYKDRFKAEYMQTKIRYEKLKAFNTRIEAAERTMYEKTKADVPEHDCPAEMLREQQSVMGEYLHILELRAVIEGIEL